VSTPGWYNDESDPALARWHDGVEWTDHVVDKAAWEAAGHAPPPPAELWVGEGPTRANRARLAVGSAAVAAVLLVAGVALAQGGGGGGDDPSSPSTSVRRSDLADDSSGTVGSSIDSVGQAIDPATGLPLYGTGSAGSGSGGTPGATTGSKTASTTKTANGVTRTEERTESHSTPSVQSNPTSGDKTNVGNTTDRSIKDTYTPPPSTEPPATSSTAPATTTTVATG
jgi:hypothetical protein